MKYEFVHVESGRVVGTLDENLKPSNGLADSVVKAKRAMGWTDDDIRQWLPGWSNGYYLARAV